MSLFHDNDDDQWCNDKQKFRISSYKEKKIHSFIWIIGEKFEIDYSIYTYRMVYKNVKQTIFFVNFEIKKMNK